MHGIRDYGVWTDKLRTVIEAEAADPATAIVSKKYGRFLMLPFLMQLRRRKCFASAV
jgi:hypothetical protein